MKIKMNVLGLYFILLTIVQVHAQNAEVPSKKPSKNATLSFKLFGGPSLMLAENSQSMDPQLERHANELKSGGHWGFEIHHLSSKKIGYGLIYKQFNSSNYDSNVELYLNGSSFSGIENDIKISFIGPSIISNNLLGTKKSALVSTLSIGRLKYHNNEYIENLVFRGSKATLGMNVGLGYDFVLDKNIALGLGVHLLLGGINELDVELNGVTQTEDLDERVNLSRLDLSIGLRWLL